MTINYTESIIKVRAVPCHAIRVFEKSNFSSLS
jgi:hypothetical protein